MVTVANTGKTIAVVMAGDVFGITRYCPPFQSNRVVVGMTNLSPDHLPSFGLAGG